MADDDNFNPWADDADKKKKQSKPPVPNTNKNANPQQELDELLKKFKANTENLFSGNGGDFKGYSFLVAIVVFLYFAFGSFYLVSPAEQAVVLRLGEYHRTAKSGLNFKFPAPFEKVYIENVQDNRTLVIGTEHENLTVTSDENILDVEFAVQWNIDNLQDFIFKVRGSEATVAATAQSAMREIIGNTPAISSLGEGQGRAKIEQQTQALLQQMLTSYGTGVRVLGIQLKKVEVPAPVVEAQIDVQKAKTEQEKLRNQAEAYRNDIIPRARGDAQKMIQEAEGYKQRVVADSKGNVSRFLAVYNEYKDSRQVTKDRIYIETMQEIMKNMDKILLDNKNGVVPYMPIDGLKAKSGSSQ